MPRPQDLNRFYDEGLERIRRIPGVRSAAVVSGVPLERGLNLNFDISIGRRKCRGRADRLALRDDGILHDDRSPARERARIQ